MKQMLRQQQGNRLCDEWHAQLQRRARSGRFTAQGGAGSVGDVAKQSKHATALPCSPANTTGLAAPTHPPVADALAHNLCRVHQVIEVRLVHLRYIVRYNIAIRVR